MSGKNPWHQEEGCPGAHSRTFPLGEVQVTADALLGGVRSSATDKGIPNPDPFLKTVCCCLVFSSVMGMLWPRHPALVFVFQTCH